MKGTRVLCALAAVFFVSQASAGSGDLKMWELECYLNPDSCAGATFANSVPDISAACTTNGEIRPRSCEKCQLSLLYIFEELFKGSDDIADKWTKFREPGSIRDLDAKDFCTKVMSNHSKWGGWGRPDALFRQVSKHYFLCKNLVDYLVAGDQEVMVDTEDIRGKRTGNKAASNTAAVIASLGRFYVQASKNMETKSAWNEKISQFAFSDHKSGSKVDAIRINKKSDDVYFQNLDVALKYFARDVCACGNCGCEEGTCGLVGVQKAFFANTDSSDDDLTSSDDEEIDGGSPSGDEDPLARSDISDLSGDKPATGDKIESLEDVVDAATGAKKVETDTKTPQMQVWAFGNLGALVEKLTIKLHNVVNVGLGAIGKPGYGKVEDTVEFERPDDFVKMTDEEIRAHEEKIAELKAREEEAKALIETDKNQKRMLANEIMNAMMRKKMVAPKEDIDAPNGEEAISDVGSGDENIMPKVDEVSRDDDKEWAAHRVIDDPILSKALEDGKGSEDEIASTGGSDNINGADDEEDKETDVADKGLEDLLGMNDESQGPAEEEVAVDGYSAPVAELDEAVAHKKGSSYSRSDAEHDAKLAQEMPKDF